MKEAKVYDGQLNKNKQDIEDLRDLQNHNGWRLLVEAIDKEVANVERRLNGDIGKIENIEKMKEYQEHRKNLQFLRNLPEELIQVITSGKSGLNLKDLDPYD